MYLVQKTQKLVKSIQIKSSPQKVCAILENPRKISQWNPFVKKINPKMNMGVGPRSSLEWKAKVLGVNISGKSKTKAWKPGKEYAWSNTEQFSGITIEGCFIVKPIGNNTRLTAVLKYRLPSIFGGLLSKTGANKILKYGMERSLRKIANLSSK